MNTNFANIPTELKERHQWVLWKLEIRNGKKTKIPYQVSGECARCNDPNTWSSFDDVVQVLKQKNGYAGIGYVFTEDDPYVFIDFDKCIDKDGNIDPKVEKWKGEFKTYKEKSISETGLHIIGKAKIPAWSKNRKGNIEIYDHDRFAVMTGNIIGEHTTIEPCQDVLNELCSELFPEEFDKVNHTEIKLTKENQNYTKTDPKMNDQEIIIRAMSAANGEKFRKLFSGQWQGDYPSQSEADLALAGLIGCWTRDTDQIERIMNMSDLRRDKWGRRDYMERTIQKAVSERSYDTKKNENEHKTFHLTDMGNGERLAYHYGHILRHCDGVWYVWNGKVWEQNDATVEELAKLTVRKIYAEANSCSDDDQRKRLAEHAIRSESAFRIKAMLEMARSEHGIPIRRNMFDADPNLLNVANGVIDLRTGELMKHDPDLYMTKIINVEYDPSAKSELWESFLNTVTNNNLELRDFLQRAVGYSLTGRTDEEKLFFVYGNTATGKSSFLEAIKALLGRYAMTADFDSFLKHNDKFRTVRNDIAVLAGARLVVSIEVDKGKRMAEGLIKMLTGGDTIRARLLYQESFEFTPEMKIWLVANHKPKVDARDDAIWRRILIIPFDHVIPENERDPEVKIMLKSDLSVQKAILAWAVRGAIAWYEKGLGVPETVKNATKAYQAEMDIITEFLNECTEKVFGVYVPKMNLYQAYVDFCKDAGELPEGKITFNRLISDMGFAEDRIGTEGTRVWKGLKLK